jgi:glucose/arabinose dehydrogenase
MHGRMCVLLAGAGLAGLAALLGGPAFAGPYAPSAQRDCQGYRSLDIPTTPGLCVGLIAEGLGFPRGVISLSQSEVLVADMGSWTAGRGRLLLLTLPGDGTPPVVRVLASRLDRPHGLARGTDGRIWLGEATRISEVMIAGPTARLRPVMTGAPGDGRHPLIGLAVMGDGRLAFSTGSSTDDCANGVRDGVCAEASGERARGAVRVFTPASTPVSWNDLPPFATGLRNSAALAFDPAANVLWGGENGMDMPSPGLPPDELNRIEEGANYGWPACFGMAVPAPGFTRAQCRGTAVPMRNLPAHSAPLGIAVIDGGIAGTGRALALTLHGHAANGHRIRLVPVNSRGDLAGQSRDIVFGWEARRGVRPRGAPVGVATAPGGGLYVTEDRNGTLLLVAMRDAP